MVKLPEEQTSDPGKTREAPARIQVERVANYLLYLVTCLVVASGFIMAFRLPSGRMGKGMTLLGWDRHEWGDWHTWLSYAFIVLIMLHLYLVRRWIFKIAARRRGWVALGSMGIGVVLVLATLVWPVEKADQTGTEWRGGPGESGLHPRARIQPGQEGRGLGHGGGLGGGGGRQSGTSSAGADSAE